jgi:hypothetical protein
MARRRRLALIVGVVVVLVVAGGLAWHLRPGEPVVHAPPEVSAYEGTGPRVAVIGDSITVISAEDIHAALHPEYASSITAAIGIKTDAQLVTAQRYVATDPSVVVINLGTNDVSAHDSPESFRHEMDAIVGLFPDRCVVVTTLTTQPPVSKEFAARAAAYNEYLRTFPHVADWDAVLAQAVRNGEQLTSDGVHPNDEGQRRYAALLAAAVRLCG